VFLFLVSVARTEGLAPSIPSKIPPDGEPWRIERIEDVPRRLLFAASQADCQLPDLDHTPIEIFRPDVKYRPMAIVPCSGMVSYSRVFFFERNIADEPFPIMFPVLAPTGFSATYSPGFVTWTPKTKTLIARQATEVCPAPLLRHTYQHGAGRTQRFCVGESRRR